MQQGLPRCNMPGCIWMTWSIAASCLAARTASKQHAQVDKSAATKPVRHTGKFEARARTSVSVCQGYSNTVLKSTHVTAEGYVNQMQQESPRCNMSCCNWGCTLLLLHV